MLLLDSVMAAALVLPQREPTQFGHTATLPESKSSRSPSVMPPVVRHGKMIQVNAAVQVAC
jgi:hypothetical protein